MCNVYCVLVGWCCRKFILIVESRLVYWLVYVKYEISDG